jgi:hypothetical protein
MIMMFQTISEEILPQGALAASAGSEKPVSGTPTAVHLGNSHKCSFNATNAEYKVGKTQIHAKTPKH